VLGSIVLTPSLNMNLSMKNVYWEVIRVGMFLAQECLQHLLLIHEQVVQAQYVTHLHHGRLFPTDIGVH